MLSHAFWLNVAREEHVIEATRPLAHFPDAHHHWAGGFVQRTWMGQLRNRVGEHHRRRHTAHEVQKASHAEIGGLHSQQQEQWQQTRAGGNALHPVIYRSHHCQRISPTLPEVEANVQV